MNVRQHLLLGEGEEVTVVQEILVGVLEAVAANVLFRHLVLADGGAHGAVEHCHTLFEERGKRMEFRSGGFAACHDEGEGTGFA